MWIGIGGVFLVVLAATGQSERFEDRATVVMVEVPVQVVHRGSPVRGLTAADFELRDDGGVQQILDFEVVDLAGAASDRDRLRPVPLAARRHFLLLFDLSFSDPAAVERARLAGLGLVAEAVLPSDLVAVAAYSASQGVQLVLGFTTDRAQVRYALASLSLAQPIRHFNDPLALTVADAFDPGHPYQGGGGAGDNKAQRYEIMLENYRDLSAFEARSKRDQREAEILALTTSLEVLGKLLRGVAGRKHVVLLSEGFDSSIVVGTEDARRVEEIARDAMAGEVWRVDSEERFGSSQAKQGLGRAMEEFRRADCIIHAVDIGGVRAGADLDPRVTGQDGLFLMADQTGGELYRNFNDLGAAMAEVLEHTSITYVLAFQPRDLALDGRFHRLKVRLKRGPRGARVNHRPGYYAPRPYAELSTAEQRIQTAGLIVGGRAGGEFEISALAAAVEGPGGSAVVPLLLEVDGPGLLGGRPGPFVPVEIYAYAISPSGAVADFFAQSLSFDTGKVEAALRRGGFKFWGHLELQGGDYVLRALVRNTESGTMALISQPLQVPAFGDRAPYLLPPLIPQPSGVWLVARESGGETDYPNLFVLDGEAFIPAARPVVRSGETLPVALIAYHLGASPVIEHAELLGSDGARAATLEVGEVRSEAPGPEGAVRLSARLRGLEVEPGDYELVISAASAAGEPAQRSRIALTVAG